MKNYVSRKTKDACGVERNSLLCDGEFIADFMMKSEADTAAKMFNEHAALVAVAEAAGAFVPYANAESTAPNGKQFQLVKLQIALDSLAAVRAGSEVAK